MMVTGSPRTCRMCGDVFRSCVRDICTSCEYKDMKNAVKERAALRTDLARLTAENAGLKKERDELRSKLAIAEGALESLLDARREADPATVPKNGDIIKHSDQVVFTWSCSYTRILGAVEALSKIRGEREE